MANPCLTWFRNKLLLVLSAILVFSFSNSYSQESIDKILNDLIRIQGRALDKQRVEREIESKKKVRPVPDKFKDEKSVKQYDDISLEIAFLYAESGNLDSAFHYLGEVTNLQNYSLHVPYYKALLPINFLLDARFDAVFESSYERMISYSEKLEKISSEDRNLTLEVLKHKVASEHLRKMLPVPGANIKYAHLGVSDSLKILRENLTELMTKRYSSFIDKNGFPTVLNYNIYVSQNILKHLMTYARDSIFQNIGYYERLACNDMISDDLDESVAHLIDEKLILQGAEQKYGTHCIYLPYFKKHVPFPVQNKDDVNAARSEIGIPYSLEDFINRNDKGKGRQVNEKIIDFHGQNSLGFIMQKVNWLQQKRIDEKKINVRINDFKARGGVRDGEEEMSPRFLFTIAKCYSEIDKLDSAFYYFNKARKVGDWKWILAASMTPSISMVRDNRFDDALDSIYQNVFLDEKEINMGDFKNDKRLFKEIVIQEIVDVHLSNLFYSSRDYQQKDSISFIIEAFNDYKTTRHLSIIDSLGFPLKSKDSIHINSYIFKGLVNNSPESIAENIDFFESLITDGIVEKFQPFSELVDQALINKGQKQRYGTQVIHSWKLEKSTPIPFQIPYPIEDQENVNNRRKRIGLNSLEEYFKEKNEELSCAIGNCKY